MAHPTTDWDATTHDRLADAAVGDLPKPLILRCVRLDIEARAGG